MTALATPVDATSAPGSETNTSFGAPTIVRPDAGKTIRSFGNEIQFKLTTELTGGRLSLGLATITPGKSPPPHTHHREEELFIILEGCYRVCVDGEWIEDVRPGSVVYLPRAARTRSKRSGTRLDVTGRYRRRVGSSATLSVPGRRCRSPVVLIMGSWPRSMRSTGTASRVLTSNSVILSERSESRNLKFSGKRDLGRDALRFLDSPSARSE